MKDGSEVLIPKAARKNLINVLHLTHLAVDSMLLQCKSRIFWPGMKKDLEACYRECQECALHRNSKPQKKNEVNFSDLFEIFYPGNRVQIDFCENLNEDFLVMVD